MSRPTASSSEASSASTTRRELRLERAEGWFVVRYHEHTFPVAPRSLDDLLALAAGSCGSDELAFIAHSLARLPHATATDRVSVHERHRDTVVLRAELIRLCADLPAVESALDDVVALVNGDPDALDRLLERQNYRLAHWRSAERELDYRRFFDVTTMVGLRVEDPQVFADTHRLVLGWLEDGTLDGVRVDHVDGLRRPGEYLADVRAVAGEDAWIVVEKILEGEEVLPDSWPVDGATGYEAMDRIGGLLVDPAGEQPLDDLWNVVCGDERAGNFAAVARASKRQVTREVLGADVTRLTHLLVEVAERHRRVRDFSRHDLHQALLALLVEFPRYRAFVPEDGPAPDPERQIIESAADAALTQIPDLDQELMGFVVDVLAGRWNTAEPSPEAEACMRFQQLTGPVMAKSVEDTAFYRYHRLVARNEVGSDPGTFAISPGTFHVWCADRAERWPSAMTALSTHDTRRSEDMRARLVVLAEAPEDWATYAAQWLHDGQVDRPTQYLLLQTMVGAWPLTTDRAVAYMEKATHEAKLHTSWTLPDASYDAAVRELVERWSYDETFQVALGAFVAGIDRAGLVNSLAQKLLQLTMPGVPDIYQGSELWDLTLVDPDNRRAVAYDLRRDLLGSLVKASDLFGRDVRVDVGLAATFDVSDDEAGRSKLWVVHQALAVRRSEQGAFGPGSGYEGIAADGEAADHAVAFVRSDPSGEPAALTVVPRLPLGLARSGGWGDTALGVPPGRWTDVMTTTEHVGDRGPVPVSSLLERFPVALLRRTG